MELLQSATESGTADPANTQTDWNESSYGIPDFDRIMVQEYVYPNTTYNLTFYHMDEVFPRLLLQMEALLLFRFREWILIMQ